MNRDRNHPVFWEAIAELIRGTTRDAVLNLMIKLVGKLDLSVHGSHLRQRACRTRWKLTPTSRMTRSSHCFSQPRCYTFPLTRHPMQNRSRHGKLFEYLAAGRPILGTGPVDGDAAHILRECHAGEMIGFNDKAGLKCALVHWAGKFDQRE